MPGLQVPEPLYSKGISTKELACHPSEPEISEAHVEMTIISAAARRQREYRERLKQDPDRCKQMRAKEAERGRIYRKSLGEENRARQREQTRLRQQRLRERRKESGIVTEAGRRQREYQERPKQGPDHCKQMCAKEAEQSRICRKSLGEEKRTRQRELARLRQQRLRERRKESGIVTEAARRQCEYQEHQKQDPDHCKQMCAKETEQSRICGKSLGEEKRARLREQARLRQQRLRERRKESGIVTEAGRRLREYQKHLKQDPDNCMQMCAKEAGQSRICRKSLGEEKRAKQRAREQTRLRQQRLRERRKESGIHRIVTEAARRRREYQEHQKQDPDHCKQMCAKEAEQSRIYRKSLGEENRARQREQTRLRQQQLRERRKERGNVTEAARRQREYRERLKQDPDRCKQLNAKAAERGRIYRKSLGEEKRSRLRAQTRLRQQRLRERRKESGIVTEASKKPGTRASLEAKREKDRLRQQKYRANMSQQKKTAVCMQRKQLRDMKKMETLGCSSPLPNASSTPS